MNKLAVQIAASTLAAGVTLLGPAADANLQFVSASTEREAERAERLHVQARQAMDRGETERALTLVERAVELSPRDAGYRMLLADLYLKNGRFRSAEATYRDVLQLNPENMRAAISLALTHSAQGRDHEAVSHLASLHGRASASDLGLAYALAGQPQQAIEILESAARGPEANGRIRQNLALAHAFAGNWQQAQVIAAQDISPAELPARLQQWASWAQPSAPGMQVAGLLGVTPAEDAGQPVRLALAPAVDAGVAYAEAAPAPMAEQLAEVASIPMSVEQPTGYAQVTDEPAAQPVQLASVDPLTIMTATTPDAPAPAREEIQVAAAVRTLVDAQPEIVSPSTEAAEAPPPVFQRRASQPGLATERGRSNFVVQIGAFSNVRNAERAWQLAERRFGLSEAQPLTTTIEMDGRILHRVSVAGFDDRAGAVELCGSIRARGGTCFVRENAGDAAVRWASRYGPARRA